MMAWSWWRSTGEATSRIRAAQAAMTLASLSREVVERRVRNAAAWMGERRLSSKMRAKAADISSAVARPWTSGLWSFLRRGVMLMVMEWGVVLDIFTRLWAQETPNGSL